MASSSNQKLPLTFSDLSPTDFATLTLEQYVRVAEYLRFTGSNLDMAYKNKLGRTKYFTHIEEDGSLSNINGRNLDTRRQAGRLCA